MGIPESPKTTWPAARSMLRLYREAVVLGPADPHQGQAVRDARLEQPRAGQFGEAGPAREVQRQLGVVAHRLSDDRVGRRRPDGRRSVGQPDIRAGHDGNATVEAEKRDDIQRLSGGVVGGDLAGIEGVAGAQVRADDRPDVDRRREQVVRELQEPVGITREVVVDDHARACGNEIAESGKRGWHQWHPRRRWLEQNQAVARFSNILVTRRSSSRARHESRYGRRRPTRSTPNSAAVE
jgi:hypothetical protein